MSAGVVLSQPGTTGAVYGMGQQPGVQMESAFQPFEGAAFTTAQPQPVMTVIPAGLPPGLVYLAGLQEVRIHQQMDLLEVFGSWERNNKYSICNTQEQQFMYAKEDTDCCTRQLFGPSRPFTMDITDSLGMQLIQLHRPFRCKGSWLWCCYLQEMQIQSPPGAVIGHIREVWTCCEPKYQVFDASDQVIFTIVGDCCYCKCSDIVFKVFERDGEAEEVSQIRKHFGGFRELCGQANDFSLHMPGQVDLLKKALLLGSTFLIDFNYFEVNKN